MGERMERRRGEGLVSNGVGAAVHDEAHRSSLASRRVYTPCRYTRAAGSFNEVSLSLDYRTRGFDDRNRRSNESIDYADETNDDGCRHSSAIDGVSPLSILTARFNDA